VIDLKVFSDACQALYAPELDLQNYARRSFDFLNAVMPVKAVGFGTVRPGARLDLVCDEGSPAFFKALEMAGELFGGGRSSCRKRNRGAKTRRQADAVAQASPLNFVEIRADTQRPIRVGPCWAFFVPPAEDEIAFFGVMPRGGRTHTYEQRDLLKIAQEHLGNARRIALDLANVSHHALDLRLLIQAGFTMREAEVLYELTTGKSNAEIANQFGLQVQTVKGYVASIFDRIGVSNRLAAGMWALRLTSGSRGTAAKGVKFVRVPAHTAVKPLP
jgi:DNA-binding CsgD family transcriptional regulator